MPERIIGWDRIGEFAHRPVGLPPEETPGLEASVFFRQDQPAWSFGAGIAVVTVDRDTGQVRLERIVAVDDCGNANPLLVEGQIVGGLAQGIGRALLEHVRYGEDGQLLTGTFMEYASPRADDMPSDLVLDRTVTPSPLNPLGAKGIGEGGACIAPSAIVSAVMDALAPSGTSHADMPLTAEKIWRLLRAHQSGSRERPARLSGKART